MFTSGDVWRHLTGGPGIIDNVCNFIIRPPRSDYDLDDLGPDVFRVGEGGKQRYDRTDFELENMRGMIIQCSWFRPVPKKFGAPRQMRPCVVYCHANCGGRYDGLEALFLLEKGFSLFTFDFCGSGMSDGEYISLGFYERQDLAVVVEFLHSKTLEVDGVALWGRSMGAVTAIMYAAKDPSIRCIVCDSPFASLRLLINDLVTQHGGRAGQLIPNAVVSIIVGGIRKRIAKRAAFDIDDLDTLKYAALCSVPALIYHGDQDDFVSPQQSMRVQSVFLAPCVHEMTPGGHNDERGEGLQSLVAAFLRLYLVEKPTGEREKREIRLAQEAKRLAKMAADAAAAAHEASAEAEMAASPTDECEGSSSARVSLGTYEQSQPSNRTIHGTESVSEQPSDTPPAVPVIVTAKVISVGTTTSSTFPPVPSVVLTGKVKSPPATARPSAHPSVQHAEPVANEEVVGNESVHTESYCPRAKPVFTQTEEQRPRVRSAVPVATGVKPPEDPPEAPATGHEKSAAAALELGTGQTGPVSVTRPKMTAVGSSEPRQERVCSHDADHGARDGSPLSSTFQPDDESILVDGFLSASGKRTGAAK